MQKAEDVARYIINQSIRENEYIYTAHLQGLLVLSQYAHLHAHDDILYPEAIVYKKLGPRVEEALGHYPTTMYEQIKSYTEFEFGNGSCFHIDVVTVNFDEDIFTQDEKNTMNEVIKKYFHLSFHQLIQVNEEYYQLIKEKTMNVDIVREYKKDSQVNEKWRKTS